MKFRKFSFLLVSINEVSFATSLIMRQIISFQIPSTIIYYNKKQKKTLLSTTL